MKLRDDYHTQVFFKNLPEGSIDHADEDDQAEDAEVGDDNDA